MAVTTYTFPSQTVKSGTLSFEVKTSDGDGGTVDVDSVYGDKYFSLPLRITNETEFLGGDLQAPNADFLIEFDRGNLFRDIILPYALEEGSWVTIKVTLDSTILFYGAIEPSTISFKPFYANNDSLGGRNHSVSFRAIWIVSLARYISKDDLAARLLTLAVSRGQYVSPSGSLTTDGYTYVKISDIMTKTMELLNETFGFSYDLSFSLSDYTFYGKGDPTFNAQYIFPYKVASSFIDFGTFGAGLEPCVPHGKIATVYADGTPATVQAESGTLFYDTSDTTFESAYEFFVGAIKSFGLYCKIRHTTTTDLIMTVGTRVTGDQKNVSDVLEVDEAPFYEASRSKINIESDLSGNAYIRDYDGLGNGELSLRTKFDFGNDSDFPGTNTDGNTVNSAKSLVMPVGGTHFELIRAVGIGELKLSNPKMDANLDGWNVDSGTWTSDPITTPGQEISGWYGARATLNTIVTQEISQTFVPAIYDGMVFGGRFSTNYSGQITVIISFYIGSTVYAEQAFSLEAVSSNLVIYSLISAEKVRRGFYPISKVSVKVVVNPAAGATDYLWFNSAFAKIARKGTPELVGTQVEDFFNRGNLTRYSNTMNGIKELYPSDYYVIDGTKYYFKSVTWDVGENETSTEAINYRY